MEKHECEIKANMEEKEILEKEISRADAIRIIDLIKEDNLKNISGRRFLEMTIIVLGFITLSIVAIYGYTEGSETELSTSSIALMWTLILVFVILSICNLLILETQKKELNIETITLHIK